MLGYGRGAKINDVERKKRSLTCVSSKQPGCRWSSGSFHMITGVGWGAGMNKNELLIPKVAVLKDINLEMLFHAM